MLIRVMGNFSFLRKKLKQITVFNLVQIVKTPKRITDSTSTQIDLIFSNTPERITKLFNMIIGLWDHNMVLISRKLTCRRFTTHAGKKEFFGIPKNKQEEFKAAIKKTSSPDLLPERDLQITSQIFTEVQSTICEFSIRIKCKNKLLKLMKERENALKIATKSKMSQAKRTEKSKRQTFSSIIENYKVQSYQVQPLSPLPRLLKR